VALIIYNDIYPSRGESHRVLRGLEALSPSQGDQRAGRESLCSSSICWTAAHSCGHGYTFCIQADLSSDLSLGCNTLT
jgi:hypothetical protein